eukprot:m.364451 g.364451  ORF g.364451 m.364451 type:complete len:56 (+) comp27095_c0_seq1:1573-1740(+)
MMQLVPTPFKLTIACIPSKSTLLIFESSKFQSSTSQKLLLGEGGDVVNIHASPSC